MGTVIKIRKGMNGVRYSACDNKGHLITCADKISQLTAMWKKEKKSGEVTFIRQLSKFPVEALALELLKQRILAEDD